MSDSRIVKKLTEIYVNMIRTSQPIVSLTHFTTVASFLILHRDSTPLNIKPIFDKLLSLIPQMNERQLVLIMTYLLEKHRNEEIMHAVVERGVKLVSLLEMNNGMDPNQILKKVLNLFRVLSDLDHEIVEKLKKNSELKGTRLIQYLHKAIQLPEVRFMMFTWRYYSPDILRLMTIIAVDQHRRHHDYHTLFHYRNISRIFYTNCDVPSDVSGRYANMMAKCLLRDFDVLSVGVILRVSRALIMFQQFLGAFFDVVK